MKLNVAKEVARLQKMTCGELREQFAKVTGETTNAKNRKWLVRRIVWRMQANVEGGLSAERSIALRELADGADLRVTSPARLPADADKRTIIRSPHRCAIMTTPLPGTLITRVYKGRELRVRVLANGFEYDGEFYKSLRAVAKKITGSHWSGNKFFNLNCKECCPMRKSLSTQPEKVVRCAIYTRKSTEEGLEQEFNSLDAQRDRPKPMQLRKSTKAGRSFPRPTTMAVSLAATWNDRRSSGYWQTSKPAKSTA